MGAVSDALDSARARALLSALEPDEAALWRRACRRAVRDLGMTLAEAEAMDPELLLLHLLEDGHDRRVAEGGEADLVEEAMELADPEYAAARDAAAEAAIEAAARDAEERARTGEGLESFLRRKMREGKGKGKKAAAVPSALPATGGVSFDETDPDLPG